MRSKGWELFVPIRIVAQQKKFIISNQGQTIERSRSRTFAFVLLSCYENLLQMIKRPSQNIISANEPMALMSFVKSLGAMIKPWKLFSNLINYGWK